MKIVGASLGECVHIQGIYRFLQWAEEYGHHTHFLGPAIAVDRLVSYTQEHKPDTVAVSYRLSPECASLLWDLKHAVERVGITGVDFVFGGTEPVAEVARETGLFRVVFDGQNAQEVEDFLRGHSQIERAERAPQNVTERIHWKAPTPLLRTHFGQPTIEATRTGIEKIAESGLVDVISLGTDQDCQENFFRPERQTGRSEGAGGVPVRSEEDFLSLYAASQRGNYPLTRCYAGTIDFIRFAEVIGRTIKNAWAAVPIFWFNAMDGRGTLSLRESIEQHLNLLRWNADHQTPVEILEAHHWGMRWAHDALQVATAILGAEIARACGAKDYIHQYMWHLPPGNSFANELAKMLAVKELLRELEGDAFRIYHQTRAGLPSFPHDLEAARSQLANSTLLQAQIGPDIIHVVNFSEPHHAATAEDVIASARIALWAVEQSRGMPDMTVNAQVVERKQLLIREAGVLLEHLRSNGTITDAVYLESVVARGVLDAPMLANSGYAPGRLRTMTTNGGCDAIAADGTVLRETQRLAALAEDSSATV